MTPLKKYLITNGITQRAFAVALGVTYSMVNLWCSGKRTPGGYYIAQIHKHTGGAVTFNDWYPD